MILGIGIDVVAPERFTGSLGTEPGRGERLFTDAELDACRNRVDRAQALGARFAAKEAFLKALGTGWAEGIAFLQVEVVAVEGCRPAVRLAGRAAAQAQALGVQRVHVSLTHDAGVAAAVVVLEGDPISPTAG
ncbi:MAG: holo-ACP synthase [Gemmatimonadales bacterium]